MIMNISHFLKNNPVTTEILPRGAMKALAEKHGKARANISLMLKGRDSFSEGTVNAVLNSALDLAEQNAMDRLEKVILLRGKVKKFRQQQQGKNLTT